MIRTLAYTLIILIGLAVSPWLVDHTGYLYIAFGDYELETSLVFALFSIIIFYSLLQLAEWVIVAVLNLLIKQSWIPSRWRKNTARRYTLTGALALAEEDWPAAEKAMLKGAGNGEIPTLNWLAAARAAQHQNKNVERDEYLEKAATKSNIKQVIKTTKVRYLMQQGELDSARGVLDSMPSSKMNKPSVLKLALELYTEQKDWQAIKLLLPSLQKSKAIAKSDVEDLTIETNYKLLQQTLQASDMAELDKVWHWLSRGERKQPELIALYCKGLCKFQRKPEALKLLSKALKAQPNQAIFSVIPDVANAEDKDIRKQLVSLLEIYNSNAAYHQCLALLKVQEKLISDAIEHWKKVNHIKPTQFSLGQQAKAHEQVGEQAQAISCYRKALLAS
ncbi:heme biosynthesis protein HemY [Shewanella sp. OPT22]|nr:heme biosynthesis protein HemY [Shewanella sp. OPT22]